MPRIRPLTPEQAKRTLTRRLGGIVDRVRQLNANLGQRSRRVFVVWTRWTGGSDGDGNEVEVDRLELLPTPKIVGLDAVAIRAMSAGLLPEGTIRVTEISSRLRESQLRGLLSEKAGIYETQPDGCPGPVDHFPPGFSWFYEVVEDGRGDAFPIRQKYRLSGQPRLNEANVCWEVILERESEDASRDGSSVYGEGA